MIQTYQDCVDNLLDFLGSGPSDQVLRNCRQAIQDAYREFANAHNWPYLYRHGQFYTVTPFDGVDPLGIAPQATIAYLASSGSVPRQLTLSGGTWPSWAAGGYIRLADENGDFGQVSFRVTMAVSATVLTLDSEVCPDGDIPAGTTFVLYQDTYLLPPDFIASDQAMYELNIGGMEYVHPRDWLFENRYILSEGTPCRYTITGDRQYPGQMVMRIVPWPSDSRSIDFVYKRRPRPLAIQQGSAGLASIPAGSSAITVTAPFFTSQMIGSIIRVSSNAKPPTSAVGSVGGYNPPSLETSIQGIISPTVAVLSQTSSAALSGVGYYVTDPVDMQQGAMLSGFLRCMEKCLSTIRKSKTLKDDVATYVMALDEARAAASPSFAGRVAGPRMAGVRRLRDMGYVGPDQP